MEGLDQYLPPFSLSPLPEDQYFHVPPMLLPLHSDSMIPQKPFVTISSIQEEEREKPAERDKKVKITIAPICLFGVLWSRSDKSLHFFIFMFHIEISFSGEKPEKKGKT